MDLRKLNDACVNDPFPTPFTNEVLENVGGQEAYSFMEGFSGYHQIKIMPKDKTKTMFATEWGCFHYTMMPFGLKNVPAIFSRIVVAAFNEFTHKFLEVYLDDCIVFKLVKKTYSELTVNARYLPTTRDCAKPKEVYFPHPLREPAWPCGL